MANNNKYNPSTLNPNSIYKLENNPSICYSPPCNNIPNTVQEYGNEIPSILDIATYVSPTSPTYRSFSPTAQAGNRTQQRTTQQMPTQTTQQAPTQTAQQTIPLQSQGNQTADNLAVREIQNIDATQPYNPETLATPAMISEADARAAASSQNPMSLLTDISNPYEITAESVQYLNGFIRTQIGRRVSIDFLVGSNTIITKSGYLLGVAANYILINELDTNDLTTCDFYNIKFIRFYFD